MSETLQIRFKGVWKNCTPTKAHDTDAGWDVYASEDVTLPVGIPIAVPVGIHVAIPSGYCIVIKERSGLSLNSNIRVGGGVIDSAYRGIVKVIMINHSAAPYVVTKYQKIAQMLVIPVPLVQFVDVGAGELEVTARGSNGFGSTGK